MMSTTRMILNIHRTSIWCMLYMPDYFASIITSEMLVTFPFHTFLLNINFIPLYVFADYNFYMLILSLLFSHPPSPNLKNQIFRLFLKSILEIISLFSTSIHKSTHHGYCIFDCSDFKHIFLH